MNKTKYKIVGVSVAVVLLVAAMIVVVIFRGRGRGTLVDVPVNQLENLKIYVEFINSKRMRVEVFFPLDSFPLISDNYVLQRKGSDGWRAVGTDIRAKMEYSTPNGRTVDDEKYPNVGFETRQFEFINDYDKLDKGSYRVVFGAKKKEKEYYLAVPFDITLEYEYLEEPEDYEYIVTTSFGEEELAEQYENCKEYVTYCEFPWGFENSTFSLELYRHLKKVTLVSGKDKLEIIEADKLRKLYQYFAGAVMTRTDDEEYGATFFVDDELYYKTMPVPYKQEQTGQTYQVDFLFDYKGEEKKINCEVSGHRMVLETTGFAFSENISKRYPIGRLLFDEKEETMAMEFYVFNEIEKALERIK